MNLLPEMLFQFILTRETRRDMLLTDKDPMTVLEKAGYQVRIADDYWVEFKLFHSFDEFRSVLGFIEISHFFGRLRNFCQGFTPTPFFFGINTFVLNICRLRILPNNY
jgi:hypothetical protein